MNTATACPVLVAGSVSSSTAALIREAVQQSALRIEHVAGVGRALEWIDYNEPCAVLIDADHEESLQVANGVRAEPRLAHVPIIGLRRQIDDLAFADMFSWGGDDLATKRTAWPLTHRLRCLRCESRGPRPRHQHGTVLIGDRDRVRRLAIARSLHNAGYDITFVADAQELLERARQRAPKLIVTCLDMTPNPGQDVRTCRREGVRSLWVLLAPPREIPDVKLQSKGLPSVVVMDGFAPPEDVLFLLNELKNPVGKSRRASKRLLYATLVAFRGAGRDADDYGYSFNVSHGGIYVRTLAPPTDDFVWLELTPPRSERKVRLVGKIAWRRGFGLNEGATVPPGFGVQIVDLARVDIECWADGYSTFLGELG